VAGLEGQLRFAFKVGFNVLAESAIPPVLISSDQLVFFCITLPFRSGQVPCLEIDPRLFAFYFQKRKVSARRRITVEALSNPLKGSCLAFTVFHLP